MMMMMMMIQTEMNESLLFSRVWHICDGWQLHENVPLTDELSKTRTQQQSAITPARLLC